MRSNRACHLVSRLCLGSLEVFDVSRPTWGKSACPILLRGKREREESMRACDEKTSSLSCFGIYVRNGWLWAKAPSSQLFFSLRCWSDSHLGLRNSALSNSLKMSREVKVRMAWRKGWTPEFIVWLHSTALGRSPGPSNLLPSVTQPVIKTRRSSSSFASFSSAPHYSVLSLFSPIKKTGRRRTL